MARESSRGRLTVATRLLRELEDRGDNRLETGQMALQNAFLLRRSNMLWGKRALQPCNCVP